MCDALCVLGVIGVTLSMAVHPAISVGSDKENSLITPKHILPLVQTPVTVLFANITQDLVCGSTGHHGSAAELSLKTPQQAVQGFAPLINWLSNEGYSLSVFLLCFGYGWMNCMSCQDIFCR